MVFRKYLLKSLHYNSLPVASTRASEPEVKTICCSAGKAEGKTAVICTTPASVCMKVWRTSQRLSATVGDSANFFGDYPTHKSHNFGKARCITLSLGCVFQQMQKVEDGRSWERWLPLKTEIALVHLGTPSHLSHLSHLNLWNSLEFGRMST